MAIIDTDKMVWSDENRQQQALITRTLSRQPDLRLLETDVVWRPAIEHLNAVIAEYALRIATGGLLALCLTLLPLKQRYDAGERTPELYDEIMQCE